MCDETSKEIKEELKQADKDHGGGPETDREKDRRDKFAKLYGSDRGEQDQNENEQEPDEQDQDDNEQEQGNQDDQSQSDEKNSGGNQ